MTEVWNEVVNAAQQEFTDLPDAGQITRVALRLLMAVVLGGLVGYERESRDSSAGLRTHMLVALGAALFVMVPEQAGMEKADLSRVLQGVISGIGFLGAGAVLKMSHDNRIRGLTTAASIWATAAIGVTVGLGREATAIMSTVLTLVILAVLLKVEKRIKRKSQDARADKAKDPSDDDHDAVESGDADQRGDRR
ncbi:MAG: methyltransferase [Rhizobacter sp.]|nr:methyltransferase [Rhizobacter sp.]